MTDLTPPAGEADTSDPTPSRPVIHLSELLGRPVVAKSGDTVGRVEDVIVRLAASDDYPPVTGLVVGVGGRRVYVSARQITDLTQDRVVLSKNKVDLRPFERREGEVLLRADLLDHRLIDVAAAELVHAYDVELDDTGSGWVVARLDTRRPARLFGLIKARGGHASRDWKAFEPLIGHRHSILARTGSRMSTLKPAQIADLLEEADRGEGGEILDRVHRDPELEADVFEELDPDKATKLLGDMDRRGGRRGAGPDAGRRRRRRDRRSAPVPAAPVLDLLPAGQRTKVHHPDGLQPTSAGGLMRCATSSPRARISATAAQALSVIAEPGRCSPRR